jgi:hypothetical protein
VLERDASTSVADSRPRARPASTQTAPRASADNGEATKSPKQIVADAAAALRAADGYAMQRTIAQNDQSLRLSVVAAHAASLELGLSVGGASVETIVLPAGSYIRGNTRFWLSHLGARAATLANRWIEVPPSDAQAITSALGHFAPATLSRCLAKDHGTLSLAGRTTIGGRAAIVVKTPGTPPAPHRARSRFATMGPAYPLQATGTGRATRVDTPEPPKRVTW